jgi:hypothetical protein
MIISSVILVLMSDMTLPKKITKQKPHCDTCKNEALM